MICKRCMAVMETGTTYEQGNSRGGLLAKRFHECRKCKDKVYAKEPNFQEFVYKVLEKSTNK